MKSAGYENLTLKELVEARIFKVDGQYVKEVQAMGFERQPLKSLVKCVFSKSHRNLSRRCASLGFDNLSLKELSDLSVHKVTAEFVNGLKAEGFPSISPRASHRAEDSSR